MPDFNPNEMDALFREGAERHKFKYNPDAWALMEDKLDRKSRKRKILFFLVGLMLIITAFVSYKYLKTEEDGDQKDLAAATSEVSIFEQNEAIANHSEFDEKETIIESTDSKVIKLLSNEYISTDSKESSSNIGAQNSFQSEFTGNLVVNKIVSISSPVKSSKEDNIINTELILTNSIQEEFTNSIKEIKPYPTKEYVVVPAINKIHFQLLYDNALNLNAIDLRFTKPTTKPLIKDPHNKRFTVTLFANPEWSSVGLFKESKTGWSVGTKVGYQFADKFEVGVGIAFSRKIYKGGGESYTMDGGWMEDIEPMRMDAKCDVIEIPIGLSYHKNGFKNSGFFTDLGINSYMLHSEWYGFEYDDALVRPSRFKEVTEEAKNSHLIGVGRFAIGYQKVLSNHTSFQFAPYLQFPLTGIGAGQVNLYSTGVQFAVKFNTK